MTYIEKNKKSRGRNFAFVIATIVVIFAISHYFFPHVIPSFLNSVATPFWRLQFAVSNSSLSPIEALLLENQDLKMELEKNSVKLSLVNYLEQENNELRAMLGISSSTNFFVVPIIKKPPFITYDELMIDAGKDRGVSTTSLVYALGDIPIGRIIEVYSETSKVLLFSSPGEKTEVEIGPQNIPAVAIGRGGGQYEIELPRGLQVSTDDFVISSNLGLRPIGRVVSVNSDPSLTFEKIFFSTPVNIYEMKWVKVETKKN
jgi:rod shape-determining protein MreC